MEYICHENKRENYLWLQKESQGRDMKKEEREKKWYYIDE